MMDEREDVPLREAMITWTPARWQTPNSAAPGSVLVVRHPDQGPAAAAYPISDGACLSEWRGLTDEDRLQRLFEMLDEMVTQDGVKQTAAHRALLSIPEYRAVALSGRKGL